MATALPNEFTAVFLPEDDYEDLRRYPSRDDAGISLVWGSKTSDQSFGLVQILADSAMWDAVSFRAWLETNGYDPKELVEPVELVVKEVSQIELIEPVLVALERKVKEHNQDHGKDPAKRATFSMLAESMRRGIGAFKASRGSLPDSVQSPEQWAYGRVNGLLYALEHGRFKSTPYDRDLLPKEHPLSSKQSKAVEPDEALDLVSTEEVETLDLYSTPREAVAKAHELGSDDFHPHEEGDSVRFSPCSTLAEWERITGRRACRSSALAKAVWSSAYVSNLPDSAFFFIGDGGEKDDKGRTSPRYLRKLPYRNANGKVDLPHLRNVLARLSQTDIPAADKKRIREEARRLLEEAKEEKQITKAYEGIDFTPPKGVQEAAELGLALRREHNRGGTLVGVARGRDLSSGKAISPDTIRRMVSYFARHAVDMKVPKNHDRSAPGFPGAGRIAWLLWGGDPGERWANKVRDQMNAEDMDRDRLSKSVLAVMGEPKQAVEKAVTPSTLWEAPFPAVVSILPSGDRFLLAKTYQGNTITRLAGEDSPQGCQDRLCGVLKALPIDCIAEVVVGPQGSPCVTDLLYWNGEDLTGEAAEVRKEALAELTQATSMVTTAADWVKTPEDLLISARVAAESGAKNLELRQAAGPYGAPIMQLDLAKSRAALWDYVPPRLNSSPRAVFVAGTPNRTEAVRGTPLAGPDGATFRKAYLERMGLKIEDVIVIHAQPVAKADGGNWAQWLGSVISRFSHLPFVALGRRASTALADQAHIKMPHPRAIRIQGDRGEVARKSKAVAKALHKEPAAYCPILKADDEKQIVYGVVLEPHTRDLQGDVLSLDTIEMAAHKYLIASRVVGDSHSRPAPAEVVESYLAPADYELGGHRITKGTWVMGVRIVDVDLWRAVKNGEFTGFSIGGSGERKELSDLPAS